jgi:hypothetical protein
MLALVAGRALRLVTAASVALCAGCACGTGADREDAGRTDVPGQGDAGRDAFDAAAMDASYDARVDAERPGDASMHDGAMADPSHDLDAVMEQFCGPLIESKCRAIRDCRCMPEPRLADWPWSTPSCIAHHTATGWCPNLFAYYLIEAVRENRATVDHEALAVCNAHLVASYAACSASFDDIREWCYRAFVDRAAIGQDCDHHLWVCAGGQGQCAFDPERPFEPAPCVPLPDDGEPCSIYCRDGLVCRDGICTAASDEGGPCRQDADCAGERFCAGGICRSALAAHGESCTTTADCGANLVCVDSVCEYADWPVCDSDDECMAFGHCTSPTVSICFEALDVGEQCHPLENACGPGMVCEGRTDDGTGFTCIPLPNAGEPCSPDSARCAEGAYCRAIDRQCIALPGPGEACAGFGTGCGDGLGCVSGICRTLPGEGSPCSDEGKCAPGLGCEPTDLRGTCVKLGEQGDRCNPHTHPACTDENYCNPATLRCELRGGDGAECRFSGRPCLPGHECTLEWLEDEDEWRDTCRRLGGVGTNCHTMCAPGAMCVLPYRRCHARICNPVTGAI